MSKTRSNALGSNPFRQFDVWFKQARRDRRLELPEAMCLSTLNARGYPTARMVLMKDYGPQGFSFFTNIHSPKSRELQRHARAALTFHWRSQRRADLPAGRQVRIEGKTIRLPKKVADAYFATRPRDSQLGSWASRQSEPLVSRAALIKRFKTFETLFKGKKVPAPPHWQGFQITPERVEFWQEGPHRLHDRWLYEKKGGRWLMKRLYP
jgi:pyridoxamine 5'-phosphate oxidase